MRPCFASSIGNSLYSLIARFLSGLHLSHLHRFLCLSHRQLFRPQTVTVTGLDVLALTDWHRIRAMVREFVERQCGEWRTQLRSIQQSTDAIREVELPKLRHLLDIFWRQPAATTIPHLRNRLGFNIDDYMTHMKMIITQIQQQEARYNRALKHRLTQPL